MKSGAVAVENSVDALRDLKSGKIKNRPAMVHASPPSHQMQHLRPYEPQLARYQPHLYARAPMPYQHQPYAVLQSYPAVQSASTHHRYGANAASMKPYGIGHSGVTDQVQLVHQHPPPPPLPQQERDLKQNQAMHPSPPISLPVQLQASVGGATRSRAKRVVCVRYKRGCCYYGSHCKFLHDGDTIPPAPQSAPAATAERTQPQMPPTPPDDNQSNAPSSLRDANFPSLWTKASENEQIADSRGSRVVRDQTSSSPEKKLVYLDAVLQQKCKPMTVRMKTNKAPTDSDDDKAYSSNQSCYSSDEESRYSQLDNTSIEDTERFQPPRPVQELGHNNNATTGRRTHPPHQKPHQPGHFSHKSALQVLLPEPGQSGYAVQPIYLNSQDKGADDSTAFSALSRDANGFVKRLDSRLRDLLPFQERAITKLQDVVTSMWSDATINVYGSSFTRLALPQSDVDCVLSTPSRTREQPSELLRKLADELRRHPWARRVDLVDSAKVPVLKVVFCHALKSRAEVMLDLTCAHSPGHSGLSARDLIYSYQVEMPALRPLVLILKSHIQRRGLNSAFTGGLSSYGLVILAIRFLQACGDEHHVQEAPMYGRFDSGHHMPEFGQPIGYAQYRSSTLSSSSPVYEFTRDGKLTWRTGLGNLLLLFLETYVTFDYRRFGVTLEGNGQYFPLPSEMVPLEPGAVVSPYIVDPISATRSIGNSFRMHEIIQAWYELYQQLTKGVSVEHAIMNPSPVNRPA